MYQPVKRLLLLQPVNALLQLRQALCVLALQLFYLPVKACGELLFLDPEQICYLLTAGISLACQPPGGS